MMGKVCTSMGAGHAVTAFTAFVALLILPSAVEAQLRGAFRLQAGFGGDKIATVQYSDGTDFDLTLGTQLSISAGPVLEVMSFGSNSVDVQGMIGWSYHATGPTNTPDRLRVTRFPIDVMAFYNYRLPERQLTLRFGGGMTYHIGAGLSGTGDMEDVDVSLDNSIGATFEASAVLIDVLNMGLRYTHMSTAFEGSDASLSASSVGVFIGFITPR